jgi:hypothetical protein
MSWDFQQARWGYYALLVRKELVWKERTLRQKWVYSISWHTDTAITTVGRGSEKYEDAHQAREAAVMHLANILPKPQAQRLLSEQSELSWQPWPARDQ